mmetsp:Transcript_42693/g.92789  ORF Transcript_42693/g.92789 Transcript_42693/m.92789 type:complete len:117 (+) Transcript_42693:40-390(+)
MEYHIPEEFLNRWTNTGRVRLALFFSRVLNHALGLQYPCLREYMEANAERGYFLERDLKETKRLLLLARRSAAFWSNRTYPKLPSQDQTALFARNIALQEQFGFLKQIRQRFPNVD